MTNEMSPYSAATQVMLPSAVRVTLPAPNVAHIQPWVGSVVVIVRSAAGVGADTVAVMLRNRVSAGGGPSSLIDFSLTNDEGPAWDRTGKDAGCVRVASGGDTAAEIGNVVAERPNDLIVINTPKHFLSDVAAFEDEFFPIIHQQRRPYRLLWIDHKHDEPSDIINRYMGAGGKAQCAVLTREPTRETSVKPPYNFTFPILIPQLPGNIADAFYRRRLPFDQAIAEGRIGDRMALAKRLENFMDEMEPRS